LAQAPSGTRGGGAAGPCRGHPGPCMGASCCPSPNTRSAEDAAGQKTRGELQVDKKDALPKEDQVVSYGNRDSRHFEPDATGDSRGRVSISAGDANRPPGDSNDSAAVAERIKRRKPTGFVTSDLLKSINLDEEEDED